MSNNISIGNRVRWLVPSSHSITIGSVLQYANFWARVEKLEPAQDAMGVDSIRVFAVIEAKIETRPNPDYPLPFEI